MVDFQPLFLIWLFSKLAPSFKVTFNQIKFIQTLFQLNQNLYIIQKLYVMNHKTLNYNKSHENKIIQKILGSDSEQQVISSPKCNFNFEVCIDIGDGRKGILKINDKSDPLLCALQFCHDYNLDQVIAGILCQSIRQKIQNQKKNNKVELQPEANVQQKYRSMVDQKSQLIHSKRRSQRSTQRLKKSNKTSKHVSKVGSSHASLEKQLSQCTYKPKLNEISKIITQKMGKRNILDEIDYNQKRKEEKILLIKQQLDKKQIQQCSFKPKINLISSRVDNQINKQASGQKRYQYLYYLKNKSRNNSKQNILTFKPEINQISKSIVIGTSFQQRQEKYKHKKKQPEPAIYQRPKTGRGPKQRNKQKLPIGEYLYNQGKKRQYESNQHEHSLQKKIAVLSKSEYLINQRKEHRIKQIFDMFDSNKDGIIYYKDVIQNQVDRQIYQIFKPIFQQMKVLNIQLNYKQFTQAAQRLLISLTPHQKNIILNTNKKVEWSPDYNFKPKINSVSKHIQSKDLYVRAQIQKRKLNDKVQKSKEDRVRCELNECTFKPKIKKYKNLIYTTNVI